VRFQAKCEKEHHQTRATEEEHWTEKRQLNRRSSSFGLTEVFPIVGRPAGEATYNHDNSMTSNLFSRILYSLQQEEVPRAIQSAAICDSYYAPLATQVERLMIHAVDDTAPSNNIDDELNPECTSSFSQHAIHLLL
jgi:hypothetical protein